MNINAIIDDKNVKGKQFSLNIKEKNNPAWFVI